MAKTKAFNSNIGDLSHDLLDELNDEDLQDKKVSVIVSERDKVKVKDQFVLLFSENLKNLLVAEKITLSELKVMLSIISFSSYLNVFKVTQKVIANDLKLDPAIVSRTMKKLREKQLIIEDPNGLEYINPYLFLKGSIKQFKATDRFKQMSLHFDDDTIKNPF